jgi:hypothetical protein
MKKRVFVVLFVLVVFLLSGCKSGNNFVNGKQYSTANGDTVPVDIKDVDITYTIQQGDIGGESRVIPVTGTITNNTDVVLNGYIARFTILNKYESGGFLYEGNIKPGETVIYEGEFLSENIWHWYSVGDIKPYLIMTGYNVNEEQLVVISYDFQKDEYSWTYEDIDEFNELVGEEDVEENIEPIVGEWRVDTSKSTTKISNLQFNSDDTFKWLLSDLGKGPFLYTGNYIVADGKLSLYILDPFESVSECSFVFINKNTMKFEGEYYNRSTGLDFTEEGI